MAEIDNGGLSFISTIDNEQLDIALKESLRRVQGLSDGFVGVGSTVDKTVAEIGAMLGQIGEECEKQETAIWKLEDEFEALKNLASQEWEKNGWSAEYKALKDKQKAIQGEIATRKQLLNELRNQSSELDDARDAMLAEQKAVEENAKSQTSLRTRLRELKMEMVEMEAAGQRNTARYREVRAEVAALTDAWGDAQAQANILANDDAGFAGVMSGLTGLTGGFSAVAGMAGLFGEESQNLQQIMLKTQSIMAVTNGLMQVSQALNKDSAFMLGTVGRLKEWWNGLLEVGRDAQIAETAAIQANSAAQAENATATGANTVAEEASAAANRANAAARGQATAATTANTGVQAANTAATGAQAASATAGTAANIGLAGAFRMVGAAIKSIPVFGWILAGISALIGLYSHFSSKAAEAKKAQEEFSKSMVENCYKPIGTVKDLSARWSELGDNLEAKKKFIEENRQKFDELGVSINGVTDAENLLVTNKEAFIEAQIEKAKAMTYVQLAMEKQKEAMLKLAERDRENSNVVKLGLSGWYSPWKEKNEEYKALLAESENLYSQARIQEKKGFETLKEAGIEATGKYNEGTLGAIENAIALKQAALKNLTDNTEYKKKLAEIAELQEQANKITGNKTNQFKVSGGGGGAKTDPFLEQLQKRKAEYQRFLKWVNSGDSVLVASANQEFAGLLEQGATYIDYLRKQRDQILTVDVAARTKEQNKQLRTLNDQIAEETKRTVLEQFNQELSEQLTNAKSVIEMLNIIERRRQELAKDGTDIDNGKSNILDDAEKDARKQAKEQTEALLDEFASYTDKRRAIEEQFNKDMELLNRARAAATTDADRASVDAAIANRRRQYEKDTEGTGDADYDKMVEQYTGYEQKRAAIAKKYDEERRIAREHGDQEMLARIAAAEQEELSKLSNEILTQSADWQLLFGNLEGLTTSTIERLIKDIEAQKIQFSGDFNPADLAAINEQLEKAREEINKRNPFKALGNAFEELRRQISDNKLLSNDNDPFLAELKAKEDEYKQYQKWIQSGDKDLIAGAKDAFAGLLAQGGTYLNYLKKKRDAVTSGEIDVSVVGGERALQILDALIRKVESGKSAGDMMKDALKDVFSNVGSTLSLVSGTFDSVVSGMEKMGVAMDEETSAILNDIGGILSGASQAAEGIASGNPLAVIQGSITLLSSAFDLFNSRDRKAEKSIRKHKEQIDILSNAYKQLEWNINKALGGEVYKNQQAAIRNMQQQQAHLYGMINDERSKKHSDGGKIREYQEQIAELDRSIQDMLDEIANDLAQTNAKDFSAQLAENLVGAFEKGESAAKAFEDTVNEVLKNAIVNQLKKKFLEKELQGALDNLTDALGFWSGDNFVFDGLTDSEIAAFKAKVQAAANNFNQALGIYSDLFKDLTNEEDADTSLTGAVKGVSEETASLVAGQMNAVRINQLEIKDILRQQLMALNKIADNTSYNRYLRDILDVVNTFKVNDGNSLRSQGLA